MSCCGCAIEEYSERKVTISIPAETDVTSFETGSDITITIKGKIVGGEFRLKKEEWQDAKGRLEVEVESIEADGKNVFESMAD